MIESPLAPHLTRFSIEPIADLEPVDLESAAFEAWPELEPEAEPDPAALELEHRIAELRAEMAEEADARCAALRTEHAEALAQALLEAREEWVCAQGAALSARVDESVAALQETLDTKIAEALAPLLAQAVVDRARAALRDGIGKILSDPDHPILCLQGPSDLIEAIRRERPDANGITYVVRHEVDALLTGAGLHVETQIASALAALYADMT